MRKIMFGLVGGIMFLGAISVTAEETSAEYAHKVALVRAERSGVFDETLDLTVAIQRPGAGKYFFVTLLNVDPDVVSVRQEVRPGTGLSTDDYTAVVWHRVIDYGIENYGASDLNVFGCLVGGYFGPGQQRQSCLGASSRPYPIDSFTRKRKVIVWVPMTVDTALWEATLQQVRSGKARMKEFLETGTVLVAPTSLK